MNFRTLAKTYGDKRRTKVGRRQGEEVEFDPEAYIVKEDAVVTISTDGWIRRVGMVKDLSKTRLREGDNLLTALIGSTVDTMVCFSNFGSAYTIRIGDLPPARSGYGDPAQKLFKFKDGERIIAALSSDPRLYAFAAGRSATHGTGAPALRRSTGRRSRLPFPWARDRRVIGRYGRAL